MECRNFINLAMAAVLTILFVMFGLHWYWAGALSGLITYLIDWSLNDDES